MANPYESERLVAEYLLFHYAGEEEVSGGRPVPREALNFSVRVVTELADPARPFDTALDLGCAVGRSSFELARSARSVLGIDFSSAFIRAAETLKREGELACHVPVEGERTELFAAKVPADIDASRVRFETGDATALRADIGSFDIVLAANLLCRLPEPAKFLRRLPDLVAPGGQLLLGTPFSWLPEYTAPEHWIGGRVGTGPSWEALRKILEPDFELQLSKDLPFLIREHGRKFQYGISLGSRWIRRS
ncbi:MAG: putative 4-mercaptohistidine N1-methyltransferase [Verrucomicrobia bacterium]|nr:putative 4-mercaptohistidine N1-methyltransferase [Verrucomicrobiota bacterium]